MNLARAGTLFIVLGTLALTGWATGRWIAPTWQQVRAFEPALQAQALSESLGRGITLGLLGGFRAVTADFLWVEMNSQWEAENLPATQKLIDLVTTVDPRPLYFWINGARIIAYDMPHWQVRAAGGTDKLSAAVRKRIDEDQAWIALALLERALVTHPRQPVLLLEMADIHLRRRNDLVTAGDYYRLAAGIPGAPYYAARIYAELLKQQGRYRDAYQWLCKVYRKLPPTDVLANAETVLHRIRELEQVLGIPPDERFQPSGTLDAPRQ